MNKPAVKRIEYYVALIALIPTFDNGCMPIKSSSIRSVRARIANANPIFKSTPNKNKTPTIPPS